MSEKYLKASLQP